MKIKQLAAKGAAIAFGAMAFTGLAAAQGGINVIVNGDPVAFHGVGPQEVNGRVLVPLRGVLEKMGAYVGWEPVGQLVTAQRGDTSIELRIGSRVAQVNHQPVTLDVPAQIFRGSTLVPLRFMSEALGAEVSWEPAQYAVLIRTSTTSGERPQPLPPVPADVRIDSFTIDHRGQVSSGTSIRFTLRGTPGGIATMTIPNVQNQIPMDEVSSGVYQATWIVPNDRDGMNMGRLAPVANLRFGSTVRSYTLEPTTSEPNESPAGIRDLAPEDQASVMVTRPTISAIFDDNGSNAIDTRSVRLFLDGVDVSSNATITSNSIRYIPAVGIGPGRHDVRLTATDEAGNRIVRRWSFRVNQTSSHVVQSFTAEGVEGARPGDVLRFTMMAEPNGRATFSIGGVIQNKPMTERTSGEYIGTYTVRRGDDLTDVPITARFVGRNGTVYNVDSRDMVDVDGGPLDAPSILQPRVDVPVRNPLVVEGRAPANSRVRIRIDYSTNVRGVARLTGKIAEVTAVADADGRYKTDPISLDNFLTGKGTTYTITATTLGTNNRQSEATTLTVSP